MQKHNIEVNLQIITTDTIDIPFESSKIGLSG